MAFKKVVHIIRHSDDDPNIDNLVKNLNFYENYIISLPEPLLNKEFYKIRYLRMKLHAMQEIIRIKPDVLIIYEHFGFPFGTILLLISKIFRIKTIIQSDIPETTFHLPKNVFKLFISIIRYPLFISQVWLVDTIVCFTEYEKGVLSKILARKSKIRIIPSGCNIEIKTPEKERYILSVATWSDRKNLHTILKVFKEILKCNEYKLVVVGGFLEGSYYVIGEDRYETGEQYKQKILKLIEELNLMDYVELVGVKSGDELQELFAKAKIFFLPSKNETFGRVFVEAMASGTPIVAMRNSAVQYVVIDGVTGYLRNTEEGQKEAIMRLLTDEILYKRMQENCLIEAHKYAWESVAKQWEKII